MDKKDLAQLAAKIAKTGFVLENSIAQTLKSAKWTVISNRYYIDDAEKGVVREIDMVAYRSATVQHFTVLTALLISCKKMRTTFGRCYPESWMSVTQITIGSHYMPGRTTRP
jgi:hypothetical protein